MAQRQFRSDDTSVWNDRYGSGSSGALTISSNFTDNAPRASVNGTIAGTTLNTNTSSGFSNGDLVLIHQTREGMANAGTWELNKIASGVGTASWTMVYPLVDSYSGTAQAIKLIQYGNITIDSGGAFAGYGWDGLVGGVSVLLSNGTVNVNGTMDISGVGFRGYTGGNNAYGRRGESSSSIGSEQSSGANGAGGGGGVGGVYFGGGGGGGAGHANYGNSGGQGGTSGTGGTRGDPDTDVANLTNIRMGAAGGSGGSYYGTGLGGVGGRGAGALIIIAKTINIGASANGIFLNGGTGGNGTSGDAGGGGAGAGGSLLLKAQTISLSTSKVSIAGGSGGSPNASGGFGGSSSIGRMAIEYSNTYSGSTADGFTATFNGLLSDPNPQAAKANIKAVTLQANSVQLNIRKNNNTQNNSAKANLIKFRGIQGNSVLANFNFTHYEKKYDYRVYSGTTGAYITTWSSEVISEPSFRTVINGGPGEVVVALKRNFDDFGEGDDITLNNKVELWCADRDNPSGIMIYAGSISGYRPVLDGQKEYIEVTTLHNVTEFANIILRNSDGSTEVPELSQDPSQIFKDVLDRYRADGGRIYYTPTSIDNTNTTVSYTFSTYSVKDAVDKGIELAPDKWYWRVDPDNTFHMHTSNFAAADHTLYIGKHISKLETWRRAEDIVNRVYFVGGGEPKLYRVYSNSGSISQYGIRATTYVDSRVELSDTADTIANRIIDQKKDPEIRTLLTIVDNNGLDARKGYDIESVKVGQTIRIFGLKPALRTTSLWDIFEWDVDVWDQTLAAAATDVLQVQSISYEPNSISIEASSRLPVISKRIEDVNRNLVQSQTVDTPADPDVA